MNNTELFIMQFYESISVICPYELSIMHIAEKLNMEVCFWNFGSAIAQFNGIHKMFINKRLSEQQQWQEFGHEMYHYFYDETNYDLLHENYAEYGESKADYFAYHFCVRSEERRVGKEWRGGWSRSQRTTSPRCCVRM